MDTDTKEALAERCLSLQQAVLDMASQMAAAERRRSSAREEVQALETLVDGLVAKLAAVKHPGSGPTTKLTNRRTMTNKTNKKR